MQPNKWTMPVCYTRPNTGTACNRKLNEFKK